ncbi:MAG TPA: carboxylating nicotinate-nucleotide diphosphorylase [Ignavibacteriaceae bacterium]|nr:carboxylating nicotinate-nucleotide diphosphorylase [Ignavibacteriaceae bacterium]
MELNHPDIIKLIDLAIDEDIKNGDITTNSIIVDDVKRRVVFLVKQNGIIAGLDIARLVIEKFDPQLKWESLKKDGDFCNKGEIAAKVEADYKSLLSAERTALNFLQRMSGIATKTNLFVKQLEGLHTKILDTRKTVPGHRMLDKYAVKTGGGENHRSGLFDMVMIKDNHIKLAGSITKAVSSVRKNLKGSFKIEVEASSLKEVEEALKAGVDIIMFDNMKPEAMKECIKICKGKVVTEASGNISLKNIREAAETGVDYISVGELTHSVEALDISMKIID